MGAIYIFMAVIATDSFQKSPVTSITAEFQTEAACAKAMDSIRTKNKGQIVLLTCEKKS